MTVEIVSGQQTQQDFALIQALQVSTDPITATFEFSDSINVTTVLTNNMNVPYNFLLLGEAGHSGQDGTILLVHGEVLDENPEAFEIALNNLGYEYLLVDSTTFFATSIPDLLDYAAVIYTGTPDAGAEQEYIIEFLDAGGRFLLSDGSFTFYHQDSRLHETYLQAYNDGYAEAAGQQFGLDIMAGLQPDFQPDTYSQFFVYDSYTGPEGVSILQVFGSNFSGIRTERNGYRAVYLSFDLNRIGDRVPGDAMETDVAYRALLWLLGYPVDALWFNTNPIFGVVPAEDSTSFSNQFTATPAYGIGQPGDYYALLHIKPLEIGVIYPYYDVPVQLSVLPTPTMGKVAGTISGDRPGCPLSL